MNIYSFVLNFTVRITTSIQNMIFTAIWFALWKKNFKGLSVWGNEHIKIFLLFLVWYYDQHMCFLSLYLLHFPPSNASLFHSLAAPPCGVLLLLSCCSMLEVCISNVKLGSEIICYISFVRFYIWTNIKSSNHNL